MMNTSIYQNIAERTGGDVYIGVVGPVRSGKSTFIKRFMDTLVIPHIDSEFKRERATDELPQSAAGRTIMTTEPKFIPEEAVSITVGDNAMMNVRLIDSVGYIVPSSMGYIEDNMPRMVKTPWFEEEIPFNMAAEIGTKKVITDHSSIGLVITTDGSITDIPREEYAEAEERVIHELKTMRKPFIVLLNSVHPYDMETVHLAADMEAKYDVPVYAVSCQEMDEAAICDILDRIVQEFPVREIAVELPKWLTGIDKSHPIRKDIFDTIRHAAAKTEKISQVSGMTGEVLSCEHISDAQIDSIHLGSGCVNVKVRIHPDLFYRVLGEMTGLAIDNESCLMQTMLQLAKIKTKYDKIQEALEDVEENGYGIVMPSLEEMTLEEPEIIKQSGRYGIRLKAQAPSIHMMKATIQTEVSPIVGSEKQSEELVGYLLREFSETPAKIWESNIFGTSLYGLVNEGLHNKLYRMPSDARLKLRETVERIINDGCSGLICIIV